MRLMVDAANFLRTLRLQMRFGEMSRAPLQLLRLELQGRTAECDWMARPSDNWDTDLPPLVRDRNVSSQALLDAIALRELLFDALPGIHSAVFRGFRQSADEPPELIITGRVSREAEQVSRYVGSVTMRAKLWGFRFCLENGVLEPMQLDELAVSA
ncbi:MAG TPA: hypothetical protein VKV95_04560 [Terriglobia bacterium]|nr:hypothetical protein [Terriglobia bacterium]